MDTLGPEIETHIIINGERIHLAQVGEKGLERGRETDNEERQSNSSLNWEGKKKKKEKIVTQIKKKKKTLIFDNQK